MNKTIMVNLIDDLHSHIRSTIRGEIGGGVAIVPLSLLVETQTALIEAVSLPVSDKTEAFKEAFVQAGGKLTLTGDDAAKLLPVIESPPVTPIEEASPVVRPTKSQAKRLAVQKAKSERLMVLDAEKARAKGWHMDRRGNWYNSKGKQVIVAKILRKQGAKQDRFGNWYEPTTRI